MRIACAASTTIQWSRDLARGQGVLRLAECATTGGHRPGGASPTGRVRALARDVAERVGMGEGRPRRVEGRHLLVGGRARPEPRQLWHEPFRVLSSAGCFAPNGYGCYDMIGNTWEWTRSLYGRFDQKASRISLDYPYPYRQNDRRENMNAGDDVARVLRGGSFNFEVRSARCACRNWGQPDRRNVGYGFRVVVPNFLIAAPAKPHRRRTPVLNVQALRAIPSPAGASLAQPDRSTVGAVTRPHPPSRTGVERRC